jgi:hypothetical protein
MDGPPHQHPHPTHPREVGECMHGVAFRSKIPGTSPGPWSWAAQRWSLRLREKYPCVYLHCPRPPPGPVITAKQQKRGDSYSMTNSHCNTSCELVVGVDPGTTITTTYYCRLQNLVPCMWSHDACPLWVPHSVTHT